MTRVKVGETTREEVQSYLETAPAAPRLTRFDQDSTWVYHATRDTWQWLVCAGGPYVADCGVLGSERDHFLVFKFDDNDVVLEWDTVSTLGTCVDNLVCRLDDLIMVYADEAHDRRAKTYESSSECLLYVYSTLNWGSADHVVGVSLDGEALGWIINDDAFVSVAVEPGSHILQTMQASPPLDNSIGLYNQYLAFDCAAGQSVFLHHNSRHPDVKGRRFLLVEEDAGSADLAKHRLILRPVIDPQQSHATATWQDLLVPHLAGDTVWRVQKELRLLGYFDGALDGEMSDETESAIRSFKRDQELPGHTLLDDNTLAALGFYE